MNDLPDNVENVESILFADDTTLYGHDADVDQLYLTMTQALYKLTDWFRANVLSLNLTKTHYMLFTNSRNKNSANSPDIKIGNECIKRNTKVKFLGLLIDDQLKWNYHLETVAKRLSSSFYAINCAKHVLNRKHLIMLYNGIAYPHLLYGITLWGSTYNIHLNKVIITQKKLIRVIAKAEYNAHTEPLFKRLKLLKLTDIYKLQIAKFVFFYSTHSLPNVLADIFTPLGNINLHNTRQARHKLKLPKVRTAVSTRNISNMGPKIWNCIPSRLYLNRDNPNFVSIKTFCAKYKHELLKSYDPADL